MDAFQSVVNRITAGYYYSNLTLKPKSNLYFETQYGRYRFSDDVQRDRVDVTVLQRLYNARPLRVNVGGRSNLMWHDRETADFFSPSLFQTYLATLLASGQLGNRLEYRLETGFGAQREPRVKTGTPFVVSGNVNYRLLPALSLSVEGGRSTASVERVNPGRPSYARRFMSISLEVRLPRAE
jgi:hypothetical protein